MKSTFFIPVALLALLSTLNSQLSTVWAQGTAFTYQGRLTDGANPANGSYDLTFSLFNVPSGGSAAAGPLTQTATAVSNGLFMATLDFGAGVFNGTAYWLEIAVCTNGSGTFTTLSPRQPLTPSPYAIYSTSAGTANNAGTANAVASGAVTGAGIAPASVVKSLNSLQDDLTLVPGANITITPSGSTLTIAAPSLSSGNAWSLTGNAGTSPAAGNFLGTTDNQPLELRVFGQPLFRLEPNTGNVIGGSSQSVGSASLGVTIAGGNLNGVSGDYAVVGGGQGNFATTNYATVGGGFENFVNNLVATVGGGYQNHATGPGSFVGGGGYDGTTFSGNTASGAAATVGGGVQNQAIGSGSFVGGGGYDGYSVRGNMASGGGSTVSGGVSNASSGFYATVGGGAGNTSQFYATVGGGNNNVASGDYSMVGGGQGNQAMNTSAAVAGGVHNQASGPGSFVGGGGFDGSTISGNVASGPACTVAGGYQNQATFFYATVAGGNRNYAGGQGATVGGGEGNSADSYSTVAGGYVNNASGGYATVGGGLGNNANNSTATVGGGYNNYATGDDATVGGGSQNQASNKYATVPGGYGNLAAGIASFAAGQNAKANHDRTFIWSSYASPAPTFGPDTFFVSAANGIGINCGAQRPDGGGQYWLNLGNIIGSDLIETSVGAHLTTGGVWANASDKNRKTDFAPVSSRDILDKLSALPVRAWRYTNELASVRHVGPTAQDFQAAFGLGTDDKSIGTVDEEGVALAAIQGLNQKVEEQRAENAALRQELAGLKNLMNSLNEKLNGGAK